jgi:hypothetical protein
MTGLIWFVQVVHYPLLAKVGADQASYHAAHMTRTTWVVALPMLAEAGSCALLAFFAVGPGWQRWPSTGLLVIVWGVTALLLVPAHDALARSFDPSVHGRLVAANWFRTAAWTARAFLCVAAMTRSLA